jgi:hypothetical protein
MLKRLRNQFKAGNARTDFCDACASVCDARCRARELREEQRTRAVQARIY